MIFKYDNLQTFSFHWATCPICHPCDIEWALVYDILPIF